MTKLFLYDLETTSDDLETARICQYAYRVIHISNNLETWETIGQDKQLVNPGIPITPGATTVHGITDAMVEGKPSFGAFGTGIYDAVQGSAVIGGYNNRQFDDVILEKEMKRLGISLDLKEKPCLDVFALINRLYPRSLTGMVKMFLGEDMQNAHDADADVSYTLRLARHLVEKTEGMNVLEINDLLFSDSLDRQGKLKFNDDGVPCFTFGKVKDLTLEHCVTHEGNYLDWILREKFPDDLKTIIRQAQRGSIPTRT